MTERRDNVVDEPGDELSLQPLIQTLWSGNRGVMAIAFVTVLLCTVGLLIALYAMLPSERRATIGFRATFQGAEQDRFPNGTKFSSMEIVSAPVLEEVFKRNQLERFGTFANFKESMFVLNASRDLELLSFEYQNKLADSRLTPVDRARIENEFRQKSDSLKSAQFSLNIRRHERLSRIPDALLGKILQDTLSTWAKQAAERKGAVRYDIPVLSKNILNKEVLTGQEFIVTADMLRSTIDRILKTIDAITKIPGSASARVGDEQLTLADVRVNLEELLRFEVEPLVDVIRTSGLSQNASRTEAYLEGRLIQSQLLKKETDGRIKVLQEALSAYQQTASPDVSSMSGEGGRGATVTPQISESFIDRIVSLSTRKDDMQYRQDLTNRIIDEGVMAADLSRQVAYYESMKKTFAGAGNRTSAGGEHAAEVTRRASRAFDVIARSLDEVQALFKVIAEQNLNPDAVVYSITSPFMIVSVSSLTMRTALLYLLSAVLVTIIVMPLACLAHAYFRHWISPPHSTAGGHTGDAPSSALESTSRVP